MNGKTSEVLWGWRVGRSHAYIETLVLGITGVPARSRNLHFMTSWKSVLGRGSGADEGRSPMLGPRISVLSLACPALIGNERCLVQRGLCLNTDIIWQRGSLAPEQRPAPRAQGGVLVIFPANCGGGWGGSEEEPGILWVATKEGSVPGWAVPGLVSCEKCPEI